MKAVILPFSDPERLDSVTNWIPEFLFPVGNKPMVEHLIELLVRNDIEEIILVVKHMPYETEAYFGKGERWGVQISYSLEKDFAGIGPCLGRIKSRLDQDFLILPANHMIDINLSDFKEAHGKVASDVTIAVPADQDETPAIADLSPDDINADAFFPVIMGPKGLSHLLAQPPVKDLLQMVSMLSARELNLNTCRLPYSLGKIDSLATYLEVNKMVLGEQFDGLLIPGTTRQGGVWVGRRTNIHPGARVVAPAIIGSNCSVSKQVSIGPDSIIGNNVIIDQGASIERSVILDGTYIGSQTEIKDAIIRKNTMIDVLKSTKIYIKDDFIIGDIDKKIFSKKLERFFNILLAVLLLVLFSPLLLVLSLVHLIRPSKHFFFTEHCFGNYEIVDFEGNVRPKPIDLYGLRTRIRLLRKLPGLFNVIKGDLNLVGATPLTAEEVSGLGEEWETMRFSAPAGLFNPWEIEGDDDLTWEEKLVSDTYWATTRTFWGDCKILVRGLLPF